MAELRTQGEIYRSELVEAIKKSSADLDDPEVLAVETAVELVRDTPWPQSSAHTGEVLTPARLLVWAVCPLCGVTMPVSVFLSPQLTVDDSGRSLKVQAKSKAASHVCGQVVFDAPAEDVAEGQEPLHLVEDDDGDIDEDGEPVFDSRPESVRDLLALIAEPVELKVVNGWSEADRVRVAAYAGAVHLRASDNEDVDIPPRPAILGRLPGLPQTGATA